jgi:hypothetical protein
MRRFFWSPTVLSFIAAVAASASVYLGVRNCGRDVAIESSQQRAVLEGILDTRDSLAFFLEARKYDWILTVSAELPLANRVSVLFAQDPILAREIQSLYGSVRAGIAQARELRIMAHGGHNKEEIRAKEDAIKRVVDHADSVGPRLARFVGKEWPAALPEELKQEERIEYYHNRLHQRETTSEEVILGVGEEQ